MLKKTSTLSTLISTFNIVRRQARIDAENKLWDRNGVGNPTKRGGYEIRETSVTVNGQTLITQQLWKKVDEIRVNIHSTVQAQEIEPASEIEDLLK